MNAVNVATSGTRTTTYCHTIGVAAPPDLHRYQRKEVAPPFIADYKFAVSISTSASASASTNHFDTCTIIGSYV
jgi:hypothetical protein